MNKIYYNKDADLKYLKYLTVGIIGYGIQGRAQALNIRDSGVRVIVANRRDAYAGQAKRDGFKIYKFDELAKKADIILFLIPDQAQRRVYEKYIKRFIRRGAILVFAHGYALRFKTISLRSDIDVGLLAPRMPGCHIREYFLKGGGVPAFIDVAQDCSGEALKKLLAVAKAAGFTRAGVLEVDYRVETDLDLFTEQFLVAGIVKLIHTGFGMLTEDLGYPLVPALMELYASGELAEVLKLASKMGIGKVFKRNASPTCQYGIAESFDKVLGPGLRCAAKKIIKEIRDGSFSRRLDKEGDSGYRTTAALWKTVNSARLVKSHEWINRYIKVKK